MWVKIEWYRSATVGLFSDSGTSILSDPWITDGAFIGSWYHWPPLEGFEFDDLTKRKWDGVYISHFHADHFDRKFLSAILRINPDTVILLPKYENKWLKRAVLNCGASEQNTYEIANNTEFHFKDFKIRMFVADYCNPEICGVSITCGASPRHLRSNDSLALFEADGFKVLNANDALAVATTHKLWPIIGKVDLLLGHFGGAGPYPQCFDDIPDADKLANAKRLGMRFVDTLISSAEKLGAKLTLPYAGQYVLGGSLSRLNPYRSVIPFNEVIQKINESNVTSALSLSPFTRIDFTRSTMDQAWSEPDDVVKDKYIQRIEKDLYPYQREENTKRDTEMLLIDGLGRVKFEFEQYLKSGSHGSESSLTIKTDNHQHTINFGRDYATLSEGNALFENHTIIDVDSRLLWRLIYRKENYRGFTQYHFNQAEIGSHLRWSRQGPYAVETRFLNFLQSSLSN